MEIPMFITVSFYDFRMGKCSVNASRAGCVHCQVKNYLRVCCEKLQDMLTSGSHVSCSASLVASNLKPKSRELRYVCMEP